MKAWKKLATLVLSVCLMTGCFAMLAQAADGKVMFTDPSVKAGETTEIKCVVEKSAGTLGKIEIKMAYDTEYLKFENGEGVTETAAGKLSYSGDATRETGSRKEFTMKFTALKEGTAKLKIEGLTVKDASGNVKSYTEGSSTVKIAAGTDAPTATDPATTTQDGVKVEVNGKEYVISNEIPENEIPKGYTPSTLEYDMANCSVVQNEESGVILAYLIGEDHAGKFFMYVDEDATFAPFEEISISKDITIALLSKVSDISLPDTYKKTTVVLNGQEFPAWRNTENADFFILYAINNKGEKSLYQLDNAENTYQRFTAPAEDKEETPSGIAAIILDFFNKHPDYVILGVGISFILLLLIIIILGVKLCNRNAELDELYEEYGIDEEEETEDDIYLNLDNEDDYDDDYEETEEEEDDIDLFVQESMKDLMNDMPEDAFEEDETEEEDSLAKAVDEVNDMTEVTEETLSSTVSLGKILERQNQEYEEDEDLEDEDEEISLNFIDLDD